MSRVRGETISGEGAIQLLIVGYQSALLSGDAGLAAEYLAALVELKGDGPWINELLNTTEFGPGKEAAS